MPKGISLSMPITNVTSVSIFPPKMKTETENIICDIFSTNASDHLRRLAGLYGLKEASLHLMKAKCYSDCMNS